MKLMFEYVVVKALRLHAPSCHLSSPSEQQILGQECQLSSEGAQVRCLSNVKRCGGGLRPSASHGLHHTVVVWHALSLTR